MAKSIRYAEPTGYLPKEVRDKVFKDDKKSTSRKSTSRSGSKARKK